jgi:hypothetical protein
MPAVLLGRYPSGLWVKHRILSASINVEQVSYSIKAGLEVFIAEHLKQCPVFVPIRGPEAALFAGAKTRCAGVNRVDIKYKRDTLTISG